MYDACFLSIVKQTAPFVRDLTIMNNDGSGALGWSMVETLARDHPSRLRRLTLSRVGGHFERHHWVDICKLSGLTYLAVSYDQQPEDEAYSVSMPGCLSNLARLETLSLTCSELVELDKEALEHLVDLQSLSLIDTRLRRSPHGSPILPYLPNLTYLDVGGSRGTLADSRLWDDYDEYDSLLVATELKEFHMSACGLIKVQWCKGEDPCIPLPSCD